MASRFLTLVLAARPLSPQQISRAGRFPHQALENLATDSYSVNIRSVVLAVLLRVRPLSPELEFVRRETERMTRGASAEAMSLAPVGKWSAVQVLEHLVLTYTATTKGLLRATESGRIERSGRTLKQQLRSIYVLGWGQFPSGVEAPKHVVPGAGLGDDPVRRFNDALVAMDSTLADAEKRFGSSERILKHPILGPLTAQQWRRFHEVHGRHHLKQVAARLNVRA
jgi:hypothetical protein